jgi:molybdopterin-synthase adenylyltransferase
MMESLFLHEHLSSDIGKILSKNIIIAGCGAAGSNIAISLARRGFKHFLLIDFDRIREHNISTQPWQLRDIGNLKAPSLASYLYMITKIESKTFWRHRIAHDVDIDKIIKESNFTPHIIIDCFDNSFSRRLMYSVGMSYPVLHVGFSGMETAEVVWNKNYAIPQDVELDDPCNYSLSRTLIELTVVAAYSSIHDFLSDGSEINYLILGKKLKIEELK